MFRIKQMAYPTERSTLELFYRKLIEYHYCAVSYTHLTLPTNSRV